MSYLEMAKKWQAQKTVEAKPAEVIDFSSEAKKIRAALDSTGVAKIESRTLNEVVYFARDDQAAAKVKGAIVYTLAELQQLIGTGPEELKRLHATKKLFKGKIV